MWQSSDIFWFLLCIGFSSPSFPFPMMTLIVIHDHAFEMIWEMDIDDYTCMIMNMYWLVWGLDLVLNICWGAFISQGHTDWLCQAFIILQCISCSWKWSSSQNDQILWPHVDLNFKICSLKFPKRCCFEIAAWNIGKESVFFFHVFHYKPPTWPGLEISDCLSAFHVPGSGDWFSIFEPTCVNWQIDGWTLQNSMLCCQYNDPEGVDNIRVISITLRQHEYRKVCVVIMHWITCSDTDRGRLEHQSDLSIQVKRLIVWLNVRIHKQKYVGYGGCVPWNVDKACNTILGVKLWWHCLQNNIDRNARISWCK